MRLPRPPLRVLPAEAPPNKPPNRPPSPPPPPLPAGVPAGEDDAPAEGPLKLLTALKANSPSSAIVIGDIPPPLLGWTWPRGPFCIPLRTSRSPIFTSYERILPLRCAHRLHRCGPPTPRDLEPAARSSPRRDAGIANDTMNHQPIPNEQDEQRTNGRPDQSRALVEAIPTDGLTDEGRKERPDDSEHRGQNEAGWIVRAA